MVKVSLVDQGLHIVSSGKLERLRKKLGFGRNAMSELLHVSVMTYAGWERWPDTRLWNSTAERVATFYAAAEAELKLLAEEGIKVRDLLPLHMAAMELNLPQDLLLKKIREENLVLSVDLGILGLWVDRKDLVRVQRELSHVRPGHGPRVNACNHPSLMCSAVH